MCFDYNKKSLDLQGKIRGISSTSGNISGGLPGSSKCIGKPCAAGSGNCALLCDVLH
jgi:hypothetical protein